EALEAFQGDRELPHSVHGPVDDGEGSLSDCFLDQILVAHRSADNSEKIIPHRREPIWRASPPLFFRAARWPRYCRVRAFCSVTAGHIAIRRRNRPLWYEQAVMTTPPERHQLISAADVHHVARLARLELSADEIGRMSTELSAIIGYVQKLAELDTSD